MSDAISVFATSWRTRLVVSKSAKELWRALTNWYLGLVWGWEVNGTASIYSLSYPRSGLVPRLAVGRQESIDRKRAFGGLEISAYFI